MPLLAPHLTPYTLHLLAPSGHEGEGEGALQVGAREGALKKGIRCKVCCPYLPHTLHLTPYTLHLLAPSGHEGEGEGDGEGGSHVLCRAP